MVLLTSMCYYLGFHVHLDAVPSCLVAAGSSFIMKGAVWRTLGSRTRLGLSMTGCRRNDWLDVKGSFQTKENHLYGPVNTDRRRTWH